MVPAADATRKATFFMNDHDNEKGKGLGGTPPAPSAPDSAREPQLGATDFEFTEPKLGTAEISSEVAESVDLDQVEAEAAAVEREAARATQLDAGSVIASVPAPAVDFNAPAAGKPSATTAAEPAEPAATAAGTPPAQTTPAPDAQRPYVGRGIDDGSGWHRPETPWKQSATPWQPKANAWQSPDQVARGAADAAASAELASSLHGTPTQTGGQAGGPPIPPAPGGPGSLGGPGQPGVPQEPAGQWQGGPGQPVGDEGQGGPGNRNKLLIVLGVVVIGLVLLGLLIWMLFNLFVGIAGGKSATDTPASLATSAGSGAADQSAIQEAGSGLDVIVRQSSPLDWLEGDCLRGYAGVNKAADVVGCDSPHSAQVVGSVLYPDSGSFPGEDALKAKAAAVCQAVQYTDATNSYKGLKEFKAFPSAGTWNTAGDRKVDCVIVDPSGENLLTSLVP